jgi:hypothetical protein
MQYFYGTTRPTPNWSGSADCHETADMMAFGRGVHSHRAAIAVANLGSRSGESPTPNRENLMRSVDIIKQELNEGRKVVVGVHRSGGQPTQNERNDNYVTHHFLTVYDIQERKDGSIVMRFADPGTAHESKAFGTLTIRSGGDKAFGRSYGGQTYTLTTVNTAN